MNTGILVHGWHLQAEGWQKLVWGEPPHRLGSLTQMVLMALTEGVENVGLVVFGTGASEKDGLKEAQYAKKFLIAELGHLGEFEKIKNHPRFQSRRDLMLLMDLILSIVPEIDSKNTLEEIRNASRLFTAMGCQRILQVSCGSHIAHCIQNRLQVKEQGEIPDDQNWYAIADDMFYANTSASDVVIVEPPHRGDDPMLKAPLKTHSVVQRMFKLPADERMQFLGELDIFLKSRGV